MIRPSKTTRESASALIIVLSLIVLLALLVVGLMSSAESETKTNTLRADALEARLAADSALQLVQSQIRGAALAGIDGQGRGTMAWASQPGALRVYNSSGGLEEIHKLYSSSQMVVDSPATLTDGSDLPSDWVDRRLEFTDLNEPVNRGTDWIYPIANPNALTGGDHAVEGFSSSRSDASALSYDDRLAMPVRWIYVLEDGTLTTDPGQGAPVIRMAFWTDDESSKINLNTASASDTNSYWDVPRANYRDDLNKFAYGQPSQNEFPRYPGHPATVNLGSVFTTAAIRDLIEATPFYQWGGSENGAKTIRMSRTALNTTNAARLYATPDEFLYAPDRTAQLGLTAPALDSRRFFLTTSSRSSDLNLFGQPRVAIWPISAVNNDTHRTPYDKLIALCATVGSKPYYFVRNSPNSQTADWTSYPRNQQIFAYLQNLTSRNIPGFGGNFLNKYDSQSGGVTGERDQILTEIFDYIRCTNLNETYRGRPGNFVPYTTELKSADPNVTSPAIGRGAGWVLPILTPYGRGAGRVPVLSELAIWLIQTQAAADPLPPSPPEVQPGLILETFSPMLGMMPWYPDQFSYEIRNVQPPAINGMALFPDAETGRTNTPPSFFMGRSQGVGGTDGWAWTMGAAPVGVASVSTNPFLKTKAAAIPLQAGSTSVTIDPGQLEVVFKSNGTVFQTYRVPIPAATVPVPNPFKITNPLDPDNGWLSRIGSYTASSYGGPIYPRPNDDVIRAVTIRDGDFRTMAYLQNVPEGYFEQGYVNNPGPAVRQAHGLRRHYQASLGDAHAVFGGYVSGINYRSNPNSVEHYTSKPKISPAVTSLRDEGWEGDFDNGIAAWVDGPYLNKPDEGALLQRTDQHPYYFERWEVADGLFSPNRQVPSAVMFGSLPTGVKRTETAYSSGVPQNARPWRTLNFCPLPLAGSAHFGLNDPADFLLLDLFGMPIVEPYAISEPFSTAGRLNLNRKIVPFDYIQRDTALLAALASQQIVALRDSMASNYKHGPVPASPPDEKIRFPVNAQETLKAMDGYLDAQGRGDDLFRSAAEICAVPLVPVGTTAAGVENWWNGYRLTGNNSRERPYATLYPLLTTKSNTFTTHVRVQVIQRTPAGQFAVKGEYRGSYLFERYLDPNDDIFLNDTVNPDSVSLEPYYRFRTLGSKQFDP